jgi:hypothetical protein
MYMGTPASHSCSMFRMTNAQSHAMVSRGRTFSSEKDTLKIHRKGFPGFLIVNERFQNRWADLQNATSEKCARGREIVRAFWMAN